MKNKKLFAILTLLCFLFTLMPVAAFAAPTDFSATASIFATAEAKAEITKSAQTADGFDYDYALAQISLKNAAGSASKTTSTIYLWAEAVSGQPSDAFVVDATDAELKNPVTVVNDEKGVYAVTVSDSVAELNIAFLRAGNYTLKASLDNPLEAEEVKDLVLFGGANANYTTVVVNNTVQETEKWKLGVASKNAITNVTPVILGDDEKTSDAVVVEANGVKTAEVTLTLYAANGTSIVAGYPVALDTNSANIEISNTALTTNHNGQVSFKVAGLREGTYNVYATVGDLDVIILVQVGASIANDIEVIKAPEAPVAKDEKVADYDDVIRFQITDVNGNVVTNCNDKCVGVPANSSEYAYVTILEQPAASDLKDKNIWIEQVAGENYYTLALTSGKQFDKEGTYSVKVILDNGRSAVVTWEVKKFVAPVELKLVYKQEAVELNGTAELDSLVYVDANGVEKYAKDAKLAANGYAVREFWPEAEAVYEDDELLYTIPQGTVQVKADEKYIGSEINVTAVSERYNLVANATIKVTADAAELAFADKTAEVNVNNKIDVQVVDAEGNKVAPTNVSKYEIYYVVLDKPADAKVTATTSSDSDFASKGVFTMALTSNKVGNVTVQAVAKLTTNTGVVKYYTGTQIFAVGTEGVGDVVVMSIGSNEIVINDAKATIDAAPIVENNRTFVPFRALAEAFGATVAYDEATQAVTAELNGVTVVMTIGSAEYTVNGEAKTADVAPFINGSRTMVPVRFAAEAFGIKVIPTYDENGATADILFNL